MTMRDLSGPRGLGAFGARLTGVIALLLVGLGGGISSGDVPWSPPTARAQGGSGLPNITEVFKNQKSAVVAIKAKSGGASGRSGMNPFFRQRPNIPRVGQGTGFIIDPSGYVLTNHHVVQDADKITVSLPNGASYEAELIGSDQKFDIALLKVEADEDLPAVKLGSSEGAEVGQWVVAIGNPFGLNFSATTGIISAKGRTIGHSPYDNFIQTDASINPGNSGGPLFNLDGEVIGVNSAIIKGGQGIGFAVPIDMVKNILPQLKKKGYVERGYIGARLQPLNEDLASTFDLEENHGVLIAGVEEGGPAAEAGIERGDIVLEFNGERIHRVQELMFAVADVEPGTKAKMTIWRDGTKKKFNLTLAARSEDRRARNSSSDGDGTSAPNLGVEIVPLDRQLARRLRAKPGEGVVVQKVDPNAPAAQVLQRGDIIQQIGDATIQSPKDFRRALKQHESGDVVRIRLQRSGQMMFVAVPLQ